MHFPCLHRRLALLENSDDRLLDPVVSAMTASHGSLQSLDVLAVRSAFGPIGSLRAAKMLSSNALKGLERLEWCPVRSISGSPCTLLGVLVNS